MTSKFCIVGSPIDHSLSPIIHNAAYSFLGLDYSYERLNVPAGNLLEVLDSTDFSGVSVTMPLKFEAFSVASALGFEASRTGVVNTLISDGVGWNGQNTDVFGLSKCFSAVKNCEIAVVLGSGATARSAVLAISESFPGSEIVVASRNAETAGELSHQFESSGSNLRTEKPSSQQLLEADLVVSTVPAGGFASLWDEVGNSKVSPHGVLLDVAYSPWPSIAAQSWKSESISGLEMLIWQAISQIKLFASSVGEEPTFEPQALYEVMLRSVQNHKEL